MKRGFLTLTLLLVAGYAAVPPARAQREERRAARGAPLRPGRPPAGRPRPGQPRAQARPRPQSRPQDHGFALRQRPQPGARARVYVGPPLKPRPITDPKDFVRRWTPPPPPATGASGAALRAMSLTRPPPARRTAVFNDPAVVTSILSSQRSETEPGRYYWHRDGGIDYVHSDRDGEHWYGFYLGPSYYWTQYRGGRWWWYDPGAQRYAYYGSGYWWSQNPDQPQALYVYQNNAYVPYLPETPESAGSSGSIVDVVPAGPGGPNNVVFYSASAEPVAPRYHSDVDAPNYGAKPDPNRFALVIGVEDYADLPKADFAARDAEAVRAHLSALGYPDRNVVVLTNSRAARGSVSKYVESWLPEHVTDRSRVLVYFSGHGAPDPETGAAYLMPWDGDAKYLANTGYPLKQLYEKLNALPAKEIIVVLDSCFSGTGGRSVLVAGARPLVTKVDMGRGSTGKVVVFSATGANEITGTLPNQGHGLFTYYFLKGLNGEAAATADGVTVQGLFDYLTPNVEDAARRDNRDQTPQLLVPPDGQRKLLIKDLR